MRLALIFFALVTAAQPATAQLLREGSSPLTNIDASSTVGSTVFEKFRYAVLPAYEISERVQGKILLAVVDIPAGAKLVSISSKTKLKACYVQTIEQVAEKAYYGCLMDDDGDGTFDRMAGNEIQGGKKIGRPVPYKASEIILPTSTQNFRQVVTYLGAANGTLRLSYREFMNDMARPAFTEEYTFQFGTVYPQPIAFKDVRLTITSIDGAGLHYHVDK